MTHCKRISTRCTNRVERVVKLDAIREPMALCAECIAYAERQGMNPRSVPAWLARGVTGQNRGHELTATGR